MRPKQFYLFMLCCILTLFSGCKEDEENPLRFYNSEYEVPMGGRRYLGLESGNGDYSLEVKDTRIASAGTEPAGAEYLRTHDLCYRYSHRANLSDSNGQRHTRNLHPANQGCRQLRRYKVAPQLLV